MYIYYYVVYTIYLIGYDRNLLNMCVKIDNKNINNKKDN